MIKVHNLNQSDSLLQAGPRRIRRPGKPTAHKTRYYRPGGKGRSQTPRRRQRLKAVVLMVALITWLDQASVKPAVLIDVSDGDTLRASVEGKTYTVRLYGIDTPEYKQPYGEAAKAALQNMVSSAELTLKERDKDRYGRLVATVYADGKSVNLQLVDAGYAWWYRDYATFNVPLALAEFSARRNERGLWQEHNPTPPWAWRRDRR